jgi:hypothetical protein
MAFTTNDGQKFGSRFKQRKMDQMHAAASGKNTDRSEMQAGKPSPAADTEERDLTEQNEQTAENPRETVQAHGPAHSVHVHHNRDMKTHRVMSYHNDGHATDSTHPDEKSAHKHASFLSGVDEGSDHVSDVPSRGAGDQMGLATSQGQQGLA